MKGFNNNSCVLYQSFQQVHVGFILDMKIVASTASTLEEPSQKNTLKTHDPLTFFLEEPSKQRICLRKLRPQFSTLWYRGL